MTIHSDWARLLHEECPEAFYTQLPRGRFDVGIVDGHLQLMCLHSGFGTWDAFLKAVFLRPVQRLFAAGCPSVVVLCFDAYDNVPAYKSMTQTKRVHNQQDRRGNIACVFGPEQDLPPLIPDDAMLFLMNRHFKLKVIQLACERIPGMVADALLADQPHRRFVVDYKSVVEYAADAPRTPVLVPDLVPLGESDIKFMRYVERYGNALVHAVDGDYMAIALLYYASQGIRDDNRIFLFRQLSKLASSSPSAAAATAAGKEKNGAATAAAKTPRTRKRRDDESAHGAKQKRPKQKPELNATAMDGDDALADEMDDNDDEATQKRAAPKKTPKCWVDMQLLHAVIAHSVRQALRGGARSVNPKTGAPFTDGEAVRAAVCMMLCAGTDFSRPLPLLGPKRLWDHLPLYAPALLQGAPSSGQPLDLDLLETGLVGRMYRTVFAKHISGAEGAGLASVLRTLRGAPKLSATTTTRLPSYDQVRVTLKNVAWVMQYWSAYNSRVPTPLDGCNGFVRCPVTHQITFEDTAAAAVDHVSKTT